MPNKMHQKLWNGGWGRVRWLTLPNIHPFFLVKYCKKQKDQFLVLHRQGSKVIVKPIVRNLL